VFEITYLDPRNAADDLLDDTIAPLVEDVIVQQVSGNGPQRMAFPTYTFSVEVTDDSADESDSTSDGLVVTVTYSTDGGQTWQSRELVFNPATGRFETTFSSPGVRGFIATVEARDAAGNVTNETAKGQLHGFSDLYLPLVIR
jgi:hypothetical protein